MRVGVLLPALVAVAVLAGCSSGETERKTGDPATRADAEALAGLLHRDYVDAGADFVATAPYGHDTVLTLTGEVDFRHHVGHARAVTSFGGSRADDVRTIVFTGEELWVGGVPGLPEALATDDGAAGRLYLHRALTGRAGDATPALLDAVLRVLLNLSATTADDARGFLGAGYTWQGQRSIDRRLTTLFGMPGGGTVAVDASDGLLTQFATRLTGRALDVTVTLSDHRPRTLTTPDPAQTAEAGDHPTVAARFGI